MSSHGHQVREPRPVAVAGFRSVAIQVDREVPGILALEDRRAGREWDRRGPTPMLSIPPGGLDRSIERRSRRRLAAVEHSGRTLAGRSADHAASWSWYGQHGRPVISRGNRPACDRQCHERRAANGDRARR